MALFRSRRWLLHRGDRRGLFFCGSRGRCFSRGIDLQAWCRAEAFLEDLAQLLEVSRILGHPDVEALLLGVDEPQHATVKALDPRLAVDRGRERLPTTLELAHDPVPLGGEVNAGLRPIIRVFEERSVVGRRVRLHRFMRWLSLSRRLLTHGISGGPRGVRGDASVLYRTFEALQSAQDSSHIRFRVIAGELDEDQLQLQLGVCAASHKAHGVVKCFDQPHDFGRGDGVRLLFELGAFLGPDLGECDLGSVREEHQVSQVREQFTDELAEILPLAKDESWSRSPSASLKEPLPWRAMTVRASGSTSMPSAFEISLSFSVSVSMDGRRKSKLWQRLIIVGKTLCFSVLASTKTTCSGGSSSILRRALKASAVSMWT